MTSGRMLSPHPDQVWPVLSKFHPAWTVQTAFTLGHPYLADSHIPVLVGTHTMSSRAFKLPRSLLSLHAHAQTVRHVRARDHTATFQWSSGCTPIPAQT